MVPLPAPATARAFARPPLHTSTLTTPQAESSPSWCEAVPGGEKPQAQCGCVYDGMAGPLCEVLRAPSRRQPHERTCTAHTPTPARTRSHRPHHQPHPAALQVRFEAFCLNQCSGHGRCDNHGGYCHCEPGFSGVDCSILTLREAGAARVTAGEGGGAVVLHPGHAARRGARRPSVYVYELPEHTSLILQLMAPGAMCAHRCNHAC